MDAKTYKFKAEWFDSNANLVKTYILSFYTDGQIEMRDEKTGSVFLKKISYPGLQLDDLYIGSTITVYSRQLQVVDYGDVATSKVFEVLRGRTFALVKPAGYNQIGEVIYAAEHNGFVISQMKMVRLSQAQADEYAVICGCDPGGLVGDVVVAMELVDNSPQSAAETWQGVASKLNKKYDASFVHAATAASAREEAQFFFGKTFKSTATYDNCSLCVIRPGAVRRRNAGDIIDAILDRGYEIAAMEMFALEKTSATEFFDVYKGVLNNYAATLAEMTSGNCIALQIRGENIVENFREFCGPVDVEVARTLYPKSLRARFGIDEVRNAVHCTDLPEDGVLESQYFFSVLQM